MISVGIKELNEQLSVYVDKVRHGEELTLVIPISRERRAVKGSLDQARRRGGD